MFHSVGASVSQVSRNAVPLECFNTERGSMLEESNQTPVVGIISNAEEFIMNNSESYMDESSSENWRASCSSFDDDRWQKELKMHENFMPSELKIEFYDVMVLYSENNRADARKFCDHLKTDIKLNNDICVKAALYDESVHEAGPRFRLLKIAMKRSTYIFFFITKEFCDDTWIELSREECLMEAIYNKKKQWCVVPVYTEHPKDSNFKIPVGVRALKGIDYYLNNLFYQIGVRGLIQNRLYQRLEKERKQKYEQNIWLQKYKRQLSIENKSLENMEKIETQQEMENKIKGKDVNEVLTGASQEHQRSTTYQGAEDCFIGDQNSQAWEHQSQENDMTLNNSMQYVDHSFQEKNYNLTESASQGPPVFGNLPNMSMFESQDSRMAIGTMNLFNEDTKPLQGENPTGASHDKTGLPDFDDLTPNTSLDWMSLMSNDQSETSDKTSSPLSQKSRGKADANTASMVFNIYHVENFQLGKKSSVIKLMQTEEKSKNDADNSNTVTEDMIYNEHNGEDSQKPVDLPIPDSRSLAELKDAAELKDEPVSVGNHQYSRQRQDCRNHSSRNVNGLKLSLLLKNKTEAEEEGKQTLETSLKADIESWKEEGCDTEVNMRDQYSQLGARPKNPQKKPVGKASPSTVVPLAPSIRKIPDRNVDETALNTVDEASSNEIGVRTVQDTSLKLVAEPKTTKRDSNGGEKLWSDVNQYQVTWRSAAPLLARAFPFISLMSISTDQDHFSQDEVD